MIWKPFSTFFECSIVNIEGDIQCIYHITFAESIFWIFNLILH